MLPLVFTQEENTIVIDKIRGDRIASDHLGNLYIMQDGLLQKHDQDGKLLSSYSNFSFGNISSVDVSNPMKIMLFYQETGTIIFLDDRLAPITNRLDLYNLQYMTISLAAYSSDNKIWLYDEANADLIALDNYNHEVHRIHYSFQNFNPTQLQGISAKMFFMHNPNEGVLFFDSFGTYIKTIATRTPYNLQVSNDIIYYLKEGRLHLYNYVQLSEEILDREMSNIKQCLVHRNRLYLLELTGRVIIQTF